MEMGFLTWVVLAALLSQCVVVPVVSCNGHPSQNCQPPSHGNPPSHGGGGGHGVTPPSHGGGGGYYPPPTTRPPSTPDPVPVTPVTPPVTPVTPVTPTPVTPVTPTPIVPVTPSPVFPTPTPFDPNYFPGTCDFWRTHPTIIWGIVGYWTPVCGLFGVPNTTPIFGGGNPSVLQALACPRSDGYGALLREGTASLLNSMATTRFPFTTQQVRDGFLGGLASEKVAGNQAQRFRLANEGRLKKN